MLFMSCVCHAFAPVHCCLVITCWERADLLALVCGVLLCFCYYPMWYPGPGLVLDCIDSLSLSPFLLSSRVYFMVCFNKQQFKISLYVSITKTDFTEKKCIESLFCHYKKHQIENSSPCLFSTSVNSDV